MGGGKGKEKVGFGDYGKGAGGSYLEGTCSCQVFELGSQCHVMGAVVPCLQDEGRPSCSLCVLSGGGRLAAVAERSVGDMGLPPHRGHSARVHSVTVTWRRAQSVPRASGLLHH